MNGGREGYILVYILCWRVGISIGRLFVRLGRLDC